MSQDAEKSQPSATESESLVDYEASLDRLGGDKELFRDFVEIFLEDSPPQVEKIVAAIESGDAKTLEQSSHALNGLMSNFGAKSCCAMAVAFERAGRKDDIESVASQKDIFRSKYESLCAELKSF